MFKHFFEIITRNGVSLLGATLALGSAILIISLSFVGFLGFRGGAYLGIVTYLFLPMCFVTGLLLVPIGIHWQNKRAAKGRGTPLFPVIDLNSTHTRAMLLIFLGLTLFSSVLLIGATYKGVEVMDSNEFCGTVCHTVMEPEYTAYQRSPHSRVPCAECHIGPGADWFVKSKLSGTWQLVAVTFNLYPKPVPTPLHNLRPARETCEQCHWPAKFVGDKLKVITKYAEDERNTELKTAVLLKVGGRQGSKSHGIHWHVDPGVKIRYRSDETREEIYQVVLTRSDGTVKTFNNRREPKEGGVWRAMDCVDCHNRPSHKYRQPGAEIDLAIQEGQIDRSLPYIKRESLRVIDQQYPSIEQARTSIEEGLNTFYADNYPELASRKTEAITQAVTKLGNIYSLNVFPKMDVWWNTYPDHIGHQASPGCYRCHSGRLMTEDREKISKDCDTCHTLLAEDEENPAILNQLYNPE